MPILVDIKKKESLSRRINVATAVPKDMANTFFLNS